MYQNMYNNSEPAESINPFQQNVQILKGFFSRPFTLVMSIINFVITLFFILLMILSFDPLYNYIRYNIYSYGYSYGNSIDTSSLAASIMTIAIIIMCIVLIFSLFTAIAYLIMHLKSKNPDPGCSPKSGTFILWMFSIIQMVMLGLTAIILLFFAIYLFGIAESLPRFLAAQLSSAGVTIIVLGIFLCIYGILHLRFFASIYSSFVRINISRKGSLIFGVFIILYIIFQLLIAVSNWAENSQSFDAVSAVTIIISTINSVCMAVFAFKYNSYIKKYTSGAQLPQYEVPQGAFPPDMNMGYSYRPQTPPENNVKEAAPLNRQPFQQPEQQADSQADNPQPSFGNDFSNGEKQYPNPYGQELNQGFANYTVNGGEPNGGFSQQTQPQVQNKCPMCGAVYTDDDIFCANCGSRLK